MPARAPKHEVSEAELTAAAATMVTNSGFVFRQGGGRKCLGQVINDHVFLEHPSAFAERIGISLEAAWAIHRADAKTLARLGIPMVQYVSSMCAEILHDGSTVCASPARATLSHGIAFHRTRHPVVARPAPLTRPEHGPFDSDVPWKAWLDLVLLLLAQPAVTDRPVFGIVGDNVELSFSLVRLASEIGLGEIDVPRCGSPREVYDSLDNRPAVLALEGRATRIRYLEEDHSPVLVYLGPDAIRADVVIRPRANYHDRGLVERSCGESSARVRAELLGWWKAFSAQFGAPRSFADIQQLTRWACGAHEQRKAA